MTEFRSRHHSVVIVPADAADIWNALADPAVITALMPLVERIDERGEIWRWTLSSTSVPGMTLTRTFTERMTFLPISRIDIRHEPPPGSFERFGIDGVVQITKTDDTSAKLRLDVALCLELPLPSFARRVVERALGTVVRRAGTSFAERLYRHLDVDPTAVRVRAVSPYD